LLTDFDSFSTDYRHPSKQYFSAQLKIKQTTRRIYHKIHSPKLITVSCSNHTLIASSLTADSTDHMVTHSLTRKQPMLIRGKTSHHAHSLTHTMHASPWKHVTSMGVRFGPLLICLYRYYREPCVNNFDISVDSSLLLYYYTKKDFVNTPQFYAHYTLYII